jgi:hypothetical protein
MIDQPPVKVKPYPTTSLPDLLTGPSEVDWLLEPFLPPGGAVLLAGTSGVGKTWLSLNLALSVGAGRPWLGRFKVRQGGVLIVDEENSELLLRVRLLKLLKGLDLNGQGLPLHFAIGNAIDLSPTRAPRTGQLVASESFRRLLETATILRPALIVFDSLTRVHRANENASGEMAAVFGYVKRLTTATGATALLVHHFRKGGSGNSGERIRGSSDIRAFCDTTLLVDEREGGCKITHDKSRWSEPIKPFGVDFHHTDDATFRLSYAGLESVLPPIWDWIQSALGDGPKTRQQLIQLAEDDGICSVRTMDTELAQRCRAGTLRKFKIGRTMNYGLVDGLGYDPDSDPFDIDELLAKKLLVK